MTNRARSGRTPSVSGRVQRFRGCGMTEGMELRQAMAPFSSCTDVRPEVAEFEAYEPGLSMEEIRLRYGLDQVIKLASNENPLGVPPSAREAMKAAICQAHRYPQGGNPKLVQALASRYRVGPERIFVGNGSDELIDLLFRVRAVPGVHNAVAFSPCFGLYVTQAKMAGVELRRAPLGKDFEFDFDALLNLTDENTTLAFVTSPDNPSGRVARPERLKAFARALPPACLLVVDEAYMEFADEGQSLLAELDSLPNVAIMRTFSEIYGLAGMRIGYGILPAILTDYLWRVRLPFSLNILAEEAAVAALGDEAFFLDSLRTVREGRALISRELKEMGCSVIPSQSNFIMFSPPAGRIEAKALHARLLERGMIIRSLGSYRLPEWLRVSVGLERENRLFLDLCREFIGA